MFLRVDGQAEQELFLPLGYKWVVWDHTDTKVPLSAGKHTISLAARSLDGARATKGDAIVDRITLTLPNPAAAASTYEAGNATLSGARIDQSRRGASGVAPVDLGPGGSATFWVYSPTDGESTVRVDAAGSGRADLAINDRRSGQVGKSAKGAVFLSGGINKVSVTGVSGRLYLDGLRVTKTTGILAPTWYQAENAKRTGTAAVATYPLAGEGKAVTGIGGSPGNDNALTFDVQARQAGTYALTIRYSNPEQSPASHYNPDPIARRAGISVNGGPAQQVLFPHTFHADNFWELSVPVQLKPGGNTVRFSAEELPDFDGRTYISARFPDLQLRSRYAPIIDRVAITPYAAAGFGGPAPRFTLDRTSIWATQSVRLGLSGVTGAGKVVVSWGDGASSTVSPNVTGVAHTYGRAGTFPVRVRGRQGWLERARQGCQEGRPDHHLPGPGEGR